MIDFIKKILDFCNVLDDTGRLSITNVAVMGLVGKLIITSNPDLATVGTTIIALVNYMHKRSVNNASSGSEN